LRALIAVLNLNRFALLLSLLSCSLRAGPIVVRINDVANGPPQVEVDGAPNGYDFCPCANLGVINPTLEDGGLITLFGVDTHGSINEPNECGWRFFDATLPQGTCHSATDIVWIQHDDNGPFYNGDLQIAVNSHLPGNYYGNPAVCPQLCDRSAGPVTNQWTMVYADTTVVVLFKAETLSRPAISCSAPLIFEGESGVAVGTVQAAVRDTNGSPMQVVWMLDGTPDQTNNVPSGGRVTATNLSFTANFGLGEHVVVVSASNGQSDPVACSTTVGVGPGFATTGALTSVRAGHSATLLRNGTVLLVGGFNGTIRLATSELYNPAAGVWTPSGKMAIGRTLHTATLLSNGRVLVTGGHFTATDSSATCELYDPASGTWTETGEMANARGSHTATLLRNGKVLVAGGFNRNTGSAVSTTELYDPGTGTWTSAGSLAQARDNQTATLLPNGKVLVAGGAPDNLQFTSLSSVEVYDPDAGTWTTENTMSFPRQAHTSTLLPDGRVLIAGGFSVGYFTSSAEIYDPAARTWNATGDLGTSRGVHSATLLPNGKVLAAGGNHNTLGAPILVALFSAELYDPATGTWTASRSLNAARSTHTATLLPSGQVLIAAGFYFDNNVQLSSAELYDSITGPIHLVNQLKLRGGVFQFAFAGAPNRTNAVLATTNPALALTNWTLLGVAPEFAPGLFLFTDPQATNHSQRIYRVRSP
jgi:hypothetical protein